MKSAVRMQGTNMPSQEFSMSLERRLEVMKELVASEATHPCADGVLKQEHLKIMVVA